MLPLLALLACAGCSGINTQQSVSPATFLMPGLMQADPAPAPTTPELAVPVTAPQVAAAR
jgi:hypothetical protein